METRNSPIRRLGSTRLASLAGGCGIFGFLLLVLTAGASAQQWELVWSDEFDRAGKPDATKWSYERGYVRNHEAQYYTDRLENAHVTDGMLVIAARRERVKNEQHKKGSDNWRFRPESSTYTSASLHTSGTASWTYGRVEVRAKLPTGRGVWPAIWMLGTNIDDVGWPACGEMDLMEFVGFEPDRIHANIHVQAYNHAAGTGKGASIERAGVSADFHTYRLDWYPDRLEFYCDDEKYFTFHKESDESRVWPFDQPQYLILNLAVGGAWGGKQGIDDAIFPAKYYIDYVRVYQQGKETGQE